MAGTPPAFKRVWGNFKCDGWSASSGYALQKAYGRQGFAAIVRDPKYGLFQVLEQQTVMTEDQLDGWAETCNTCTIQQVASLGQRRFLILASPGHGLAISWLTGTTLHTIIGPNETLTEANALALASATSG